MVIIVALDRDRFRNGVGYVLVSRTKKREIRGEFGIARTRSKLTLVLLNYGFQKRGESYK